MQPIDREKLIAITRVAQASAQRQGDAKAVIACTEAIHRLESPISADQERSFLVEAITAKKAAAKTALYRHYNEQGQLLYVGISLQILSRTTKHRLNARWYEQITHIDIEWLASRALAEAAERTAIETENPLYNVTYNKAPKHVAKEPQARTLRSRASQRLKRIASVQKRRLQRQQSSSLPPATG